MPITLVALRHTGLRPHDSPPSCLEIVTCVAVWSVMYEVFFPQSVWLSGLTTADPADVTAYAAGGLIAAAAWRRYYGRGQQPGNTS